MNATGISDPYWQQILAVCRRNPAVRVIILFGSRAKGIAREGSDIDLALKGDHLDQRALAQIDADYDALKLPWKLDLIAYDTISNVALREHIDRVGVVLA